MLYKLSFTTSHRYATNQPGINVPLILQSGSATVELDAKIDTGSSYCIFERLYGDRLGLDIESGTRQLVSTVTGSFLTYAHEVTLSVLGIEGTAVVYFAHDENFTRNVLGRQGWLERVRLGLIDYDNQLYLSDYNDAA